MMRDGETYYYHTNHRGDIIAMTDVAGEVVNTYTYSPYGEVLEADEGVENPYRYASYRFDEATGLYYLWNRYYDPGTSRFITKDIYPGQLKSPGSLNGYVYCLGDPVNGVDPSGMAGIKESLGKLGESIWRTIKPIINSIDIDTALTAGGAISEGYEKVGTFAEIRNATDPIVDDAIAARKACESSVLSEEERMLLELEVNQANKQRTLEAARLSGAVLLKKKFSPIMIP